MTIKKVSVLSLFTIMVLSACSTSTNFLTDGVQRMSFVGESENWKVLYEVDVWDEDSESTSIKINYIGKEPIPHMIKYNIEGVTGNSSGTTSLNKNGVL